LRIAEERLELGRGLPFVDSDDDAIPDPEPVVDSTTLLRPRRDGFEIRRAIGQY
jgi:hypothetical protein